MKTYNDFLFTEERLFNMIPATGAFKLMSAIDKLKKENEAPSLLAIVEMPKATCQGAQRYKAFLTVRITDAKKDTLYYEWEYEVDARNCVVNADQTLSKYPYINDFAWVNFLTEHSLLKVHTS